MMRRHLLPLLGALLVAAAWARSGDAAPERKADRAAIDAQFERDKAECAARFAVNECVEAARSRQREALSRIRDGQQAEAAARRQEGAEQRQQRIDRRREQIQARSAAAQPSAADRTERLPRPAKPAASRPARDRSAAASRAADRAAAAARRQQEIAADQQRIEARKARRKAEGKSARPLPAPPGTSAPT